MIYIFWSMRLMCICLAAYIVNTYIHLQGQTVNICIHLDFIRMQLVTIYKRVELRMLYVCLTASDKDTFRATVFRRQSTQTVSFRVQELVHLNFSVRLNTSTRLQARSKTLMSLFLSSTINAQHILPPCFKVYVTLLIIVGFEEIVTVDKVQYITCSQLSA